MNHTCRRQTLIICLLLIAVTLAAYWPVFHNGFIKLDDRQYVTENPHVLGGLNAKSLKWAFQAGYASNWHPLTWLSHMLDVQLFGLKPMAHHTVNLLLHLLNTCLLFFALRRMTRLPIRSAVVAMLFAVHPLHVESVAWVAERKDVLSGFFFMLTLLAYGKYAIRDERELVPTKGLRGRDGVPDVPRISGHRIGGESRPGGIVPTLTRIFGSPTYWVCLLCFTLGLMSKPMLVTVPFLLLLLDFWPLNRMKFIAGTWRLVPAPPGWKLLLLEKIPLLVLAAGSSVVTFFAQDKGHAVSMGLPLDVRLANAFVSYFKYLSKTFWPSKLSIFYPHPYLHYPLSNPWPAWEIALSLVALGIVSAYAIRDSRDQPWFATGWFWFLGTLVPVIGIVQVGSQAMADRYTYLPLIGIFIYLTWGVGEFLSRFRFGRAQLCAIASVAVVACVIMTENQVRYWRNDTTLFQHALDVTPQNAVAHYILGTECGEKGRMDLAQKHFEDAIAIDPTMADAHYSLGYVLGAENRMEDAIKEYETALRYRPWHALSQNGLGAMLWREGRFGEAEEHYREALRLKPDFADAHFNLGVLYSSRKQLSDAEAQFSDAVRLDPENQTALSRLAETLMKEGKWAEAESRARDLAKLSPQDVETHLHLAEILDRSGKSAEAVPEYEEAARLKPALPEIHYALGKLLFRRTNFSAAITSLQKSLDLNSNFTEARIELGRALAAESKPSEAEAQFRQAVSLEPTNSEATLALAITLLAQGRTNDAAAWFSKTAGLNPAMAGQNLEKGKSLAAAGQTGAAIAALNVAIALAPENGEAHDNLGLLLAGEGKIDEAASEFEAAIRAAQTAEAYHHLGLARFMQGRPREALTNYQKAVSLRPDWPEALNDLAWLLATLPQDSLRNGAEAIRLALRACDLTGGKEARYWGTLDASYAEAGRFADAIAAARKAEDLAAAAGDTNLQAAATKRLALYEKGKAFRQ